MLQALKRVSLFSSFSDEELQYLEDFCEKVTFSKAEIIIESGVPHSSLFTILSGTVRVVREVNGRELILASLSTGETLGELSFIEPGESSAACKALTNVELLRLDREMMDRIAAENPEIGVKLWHALAVELKHRLIRTNENLASFFNISQTLSENEQFRAMYGTCFR